jgi:Cu/Ag efflux protein CusF
LRIFGKAPYYGWIEDLDMPENPAEPTARCARATACRYARVSIVLLGILLTINCRGVTENPGRSRTYPVIGQVTVIIPEMQRIVVRHDGIKDWMPASNFEFSVKNPAELQGLAVGDNIEAILLADGEKFWLTQIKVIKGPAGQ